MKTTNLPWVLDEETLAKDLNVKAPCPMNDLDVVALPRFGQVGEERVCFGTGVPNT